MTRDTDDEVQPYDARVMREMFGLDPMRPRDEFDVDVHPESVRGHVLALYDATDEAVAVIRSTRSGRFLWAVDSRFRRLLRWLRR